MKFCTVFTLQYNHHVHVARVLTSCKMCRLVAVVMQEIFMPHQWVVGNLPVSAKCLGCEKTCGSVLRLQDLRCLWCRCTVSRRVVRHVIIVAVRHVVVAVTTAAAAACHALFVVMMCHISQ